MSKQSNADVPVVNIANALTVVRLVLVPVFIVMVLRGNDMGMLVATLVFTVAALTDKLDGYLARRLNLITNFGKLADPIADKALTMSALVLLSCLGQLWWWVTIVIIVRELGITFMRMAMVRKGAVMAASKGGKLKTTLQMVAIVGLLMPWQMFLSDAIASGLIATALCIMMVALLVTVVTGVDYVQQAITLNRAKEAK
jgi:CDP-diacylglycerol--glycerol-3-phosphate 3-phosphatidyltransferase